MIIPTICALPIKARSGCPLPASFAPTNSPQQIWARAGIPDVAEIDVEVVRAACSGACLSVDQRQTKLSGQVFVDAAVAGAGVDQGRDGVEYVGAANKR
jgi:hypothetical protein